MNTLDPIDLGIAWDRLIAITDEVLQSVVRTAFSVGVREAWDLACVLFDAQGRSIAQATLSMPAFIGTAPLTMAHMLKRFPAQEWAEGDVVATNDPWLGTGHTPDLCLAQPIVHRGRRVGFVMTISHLPDIGGAGLSVANTSLYQEGLILPVCKLHEAGRAVPLLHELIAANVRTPNLVFGDIGAGIAGGALAARRVSEFLDEAGMEDLQALADGIIQRSEAAMRGAIADIPDGQYTHAIEVETVDDRVTLACTVAVAGDTMLIDFEGTGPVARHAVNVPACYTQAFARYAIKCITVPGIPNNLGMLQPVAVRIPEGCILDAPRPAATGGRHTVGWFIVPLLHGALAQAVPHRVQADAGMASLFIGLVDRQTSQHESGTASTASTVGTRETLSEAESFSAEPERRVQTTRIEAQGAAVVRATASICNEESGCSGVQGGLGGKTLSLSVQYFLAGGLGGMQGLDGHATTPSPTNNAVVATEIWEAETGVRVEYRRLLPDSGGPGTFRGGLGQEAALTNASGQPVTLFLFGLRTEIPAQGLLGGQPGQPRRYRVDGQPIPPKGRLELLPGQTLTLTEAGGGGWGEPRQRDPARVREDVQRGYVTPAAALRDYGMVV